MNDTDKRDARRAQLMGIAWQTLWIEQGRGRRKNKVATWVPVVGSNESPQYQWLWIPPYLDEETDLDEYRGQQVGKTILSCMAKGEVVAENQFWMDEAKQESERTGESWLFLDVMLQADGWKTTEAQTKDGESRFIWAKGK